MATIHSIKTGDKVTGLYVGVPFTGTVTSHRPHTMNHHIELFFVDFDTPIDVFGSARESACVDASDDAAALERYLRSGHQYRNELAAL